MSEQTKISPDLDDLLTELRFEIFANLNCIQIGKIQSFNKSEQTAEIEPQVKRRLSGGETASYPLLVDCPVVVMQGGGAFLEFPIKAGDYCLILFNDRDMDTWWDTANVKEPRSTRKHALSDGFALVGINPRTSVLDLSGASVVLNGGPNKVNLKNDSGEDLATLTEDFNQAVQDIKTTGSSTTHVLDPATKAVFVALDTRSKNLLG